MKVTIKVYRIELRSDGSKNLELAEEFEYNKESIVIGRGKACDLVLLDKESSRQHAIIDCGHPKEVVAIDLGSTNGTFIKDQKVARIALKSGDRIRIGSHELEIVFKSDPVVLKEREDGRYDPFEVAHRDETDKLDRQQAPILTTSAKPQKKSEPSRVTKKIDLPKPALSERDLKSVDEVERDVAGAARDAEVSLEKAKSFVPATPSTDPTFATPTLFQGKKKRKDDTFFESRRILQVTMLWNRSVFNIKHYWPGESVWVGESLKNDFIFPANRMPDKFKLLRVQRENCLLYFKPEMEGVIELGGKRLTFSEMAERSKPLAQRRGSSLYEYDLDFKDRVLLSFGSVELFIQFVPPQPPIPADWYKIQDKGFWKIGAGTTIVYLLCLMMVNFALRMVGELSPEEQFQEMPDRIAKLILEPPKPIRPPVKKMDVAPTAKTGEVGGKTLEHPGKGDEGEGARAKGIEGKRGRSSGKVNTIARNVGTTTKGQDTGFRVPKGAGGRETDPDRAKAGLPGSKQVSGARTVGSSKSKIDYGEGILKAAQPRRTISDEQVALGSGILGVLGSGGGGGRGTSGGALAGQGLGGDVEGALKGLERGTIVDSRGTGGRGIEGVGTGGGGKSEGVGGLGLRGSGGGFRGTGMGTLGTKGEREVTAVQEEVIYEGNLTADQIREVVNRHIGELRACYEKAAILQPSLGGKVDIYWEIDSGGGVQSLRILSSTLKNVQVESCIGDRIRRWQFPQPRGGGTAIVRRYPFNFRSL